MFCTVHAERGRKTHMKGWEKEQTVIGVKCLMSLQVHELSVREMYSLLLVVIVLVDLCIQYDLFNLFAQS